MLDEVIYIINTLLGEKLCKCIDEFLVRKGVLTFYRRGGLFQVEGGGG